MVTRVRIVNFQSLADVSIDVGKLTVLSGPSNTGKSAFVRAVRVLLSNPRGDWYRRGEGEVRAGLAVDDGGDFTYHVNFWRSKQVRYSLETKDHVAPDDPDPADFTAVGTSVPAEVMSILRIDPDLQTTDQFDPPYLLSLTASAVAKTLGTLTKADLMMSASGRANTESRDRKKNAEALSAMIQRDRDYLETNYSWYGDAANAMRTAHPIRVRLEAVARRREAVSSHRPVLASLAHRAAWQTPGEVASLATLLEHVRLLERRGKDLLRARAQADLATLAYEAALGHLSDAQRLLARAHKDEAFARGMIDNCPTCGQELSDDLRQSLKV